MCKKSAWRGDLREACAPDFGVLLPGRCGSPDRTTFTLIDKAVQPFGQSHEKRAIRRAVRSGAGTINASMVCFYRRIISVEGTMAKDAPILPPT
jgi:hypothetical protein